MIHICHIHNIHIYMIAICRRISSPCVINLKHAVRSVNGFVLMRGCCCVKRVDLTRVSQIGNAFAKSPPLLPRQSHKPHRKYLAHSIRSQIKRSVCDMAMASTVHHNIYIQLAASVYAASIVALCLPGKCRDVSSS